MDIRLQALQTLQQRGDVPSPATAARWLTVFAPAGFSGYGGTGCSLTSWSTGLQLPQTMVWPDTNVGDPFDFIVVFPEKDQRAALAQVGLALRSAGDAGTVVIVAENDAGGKRLGPLLTGFGVQQFDDHAKHHCRVVVVRLAGQMLDRHGIDAAIAQGTQPVLNKHGFYAMPGLHSEQGIDDGSALLATCLPDDLRGVGADFGCGWGFLTLEMLKKCPKIERVFAIDADQRALTCLQQNVQQLGPDLGTRVTPLRGDLQGMIQGVKGLDFIIMNPPFHAGKHAIPSLGLAMIRTAAASLRPGRRLVMVANRHLPYEEVLNTVFGRTEILTQAKGFKVYVATKA